MLYDLCTISGGLDDSDAFRDVDELGELAAFVFEFDEFLNLHQFFKRKENSLRDVIWTYDLIIYSIKSFIFFLKGRYNIYLQFRFIDYLIDDIILPLWYPKFSEVSSSYFILWKPYSSLLLLTI